MHGGGGEEPEFESLNSIKTVPANDGAGVKFESEFRSVAQAPQAYSFRKKVNLKLPKIDELVADEGLPSVSHKFQPGESGFLMRRDHSPKEKSGGNKIKRALENGRSPVIEADDVGVHLKQGLFLEEAIALAAKEEGMERRTSDMRRWHTQLDEEDKRQLNKDIQLIKEKLKTSSSKRKNTQIVEASAYHTYTLCCCFLKFGQTKNAYMCILINDVILSANLTLYGLISTLDWRYFITPLICVDQ